MVWEGAPAGFSDGPPIPIPAEDPRRTGYDASPPVRGTAWSGGVRLPARRGGRFQVISPPPDPCRSRPVGNGGSSREGILRLEM